MPKKPSKPAKAFNPFDEEEPSTDDGGEFDPFGDEGDALEFQPDGATSITSVPKAEKTRIIEERTRIKPQPSAPAKKGLKLTFEELSDQGGDIRGASAIGSENLGAD